MIINDRYRATLTQKEPVIKPLLNHLEPRAAGVPLDGINPLSNEGIVGSIRVCESKVSELFNRGDFRFLAAKVHSDLMELKCSTGPKASLIVRLANVKDGLQPVKSYSCFLTLSIGEREVYRSIHELADGGLASGTIKYYKHEELDVRSGQVKRTEIGDGFVVGKSDLASIMFTVSGFGIPEPEMVQGRNTWTGVALGIASVVLIVVGILVVGRGRRRASS